MFSYKKTAAVPLAVLLISSPISAFAATYDALCEGSNCQISVSGRGIGGPEGFIPAELISKWSVGQNTGYHGGKGVAGGLGGATAGAIAGGILLGPIGLLGGLIGGGIAGSGAGKEFEGYFTVAGYNKEGKKIAHSFYFINPKPAKRLRSSLPSITGLSLGEERSAEELETAFAAISSKGSIANGDSEPLPGRLGNALSVQNKPTKSSLPTRLGESERAKDIAIANCWEKHLSSNPSLEIWANANPTRAENQRLKSGFDKCEGSKES